MDFSRLKTLANAIGMHHSGVHESPEWVTLERCSDCGPLTAKKPWVRSKRLLSMSTCRLRVCPDRTLTFWWALTDSNRGPRDYESPALTAELRARPLSNLACGC